MKKYGMLLIMVLVVCFTGCSENGKKDEGLNSDIEEIALNLEEVSNLSSLEKEYLSYRI